MRQIGQCVGLKLSSIIAPCAPKFSGLRVADPDSVLPKVAVEIPFRVFGDNHDAGHGVLGPRLNVLDVCQWDDDRAAVDAFSYLSHICLLFVVAQTSFSCDFEANLNY